LPTAINSPYEHNEESSSVESSIDLRSVSLGSSHGRSHFGCGSSTSRIGNWLIMPSSPGRIIQLIVSSLGAVNLPHSCRHCANVTIWSCLAATNVPMTQLGAAPPQALALSSLSYLTFAITVSVGLTMPGVFSPSPGYVLRLQSVPPPTNRYASDSR
jgi:hypothetical protein